MYSDLDNDEQMFPNAIRSAMTRDHSNTQSAEA